MRSGGLFRPGEIADISSGTQLERMEPNMSHAAAASPSPSTINGAPVGAATVGSQLHASPAIRAAVKTIVAELKAKSALITDSRPPNPALKESYEALMKRCADVRGRPLLYPYVGSGAGNGALVELADGSVKWDMICGIGVHFFGHSDADLAEAALLAGVDDTVKHGNLQSNFEAYGFAEALLNEAKKNSKLKHAYIATGGAMANENALKVCLQKKFADNLTSLAGGANVKIETLLANCSAQQRVIAFKDCFMGRSITMANIGDNHQGREGMPGAIPVDYMPFWDAAAAERMASGPAGKKRFIDMCVAHLEQYIHRYPGAHACFIFELVQGEGGFHVGDRDYFKALMDVCKNYKIAVWDDEIQSFGRGRNMFAYETFNLGEYVDVFCVGKMTQACATLWTEAFNPKSALLSGTFTGEGLSFRVGQRVIERLRDGGYYGDNGIIARHEAAFRTHAKALIDKHPEWFPAVPELNGGGEKLVGGSGGMMRFTPYGGNKEKILKAAKTCFEEGVILFYCGHGPYHVRMLPPLGVMKLEDWPKVFACIERGMAKAGA
jgi:4-aminobutyrate aminotransferase-like enzyme